ncbi:MAG TPA: alpha/beta hydrolase, partial [Kofleriaceae bacterium]|nr:alpha/beta hydrolase [Kofleriaceae bacterium]
NAASHEPISTPVLYVRGDREPGELAAYVRGLEDAGLRAVSSALIPGSGHFVPDEQPARLAAELRRFVGVTGAGAAGRSA